MKVPVACEQCGRRYTEYVFMALYVPATGSTRLAHDLHCPDCSYCQKLNMPPLLLVRTARGMNVEPTVGRPL